MCVESILKNLSFVSNVIFTRENTAKSAFCDTNPKAARLLITTSAVDNTNSSSYYEGQFSLAKGMQKAKLLGAHG